MKKRKTLITVALIAIAVSLVYLVILMRWTYCMPNDIAGQERMFVESYAFLPVPIIGLLAGVLLQALTIYTDKKKKN